jgi:hypothetical protein
MMADHKSVTRMLKTARGQIDGIDGPKTRAALHQALLAQLIGTALAIAVAMCLSACTIGPDYVRPTVDTLQASALDLLDRMIDPAAVTR